VSRISNGMIHPRPHIHLRELLDKRKAEGQTTFICFIDLINAFPSSWQDGMWFRCRESGVAGRLYRSIKDMSQSLMFICHTNTVWVNKLVYIRFGHASRGGLVTLPFLFVDLAPCSCSAPWCKPRSRLQDCLTSVRR
jgi:hypothetical protein